MSRPSRHLTFDENQKVFGMLGQRKESLSTAVIQLLFGTNSQPSTWQLQVTGVICFVKDPIRKGFFFEVKCFNFIPIKETYICRIKLSIIIIHNISIFYMLGI